MNRSEADRQVRLPPIEVRSLGTVEYEPTWRAMQAFTAKRTPETQDEIWLLQHPPVYTVGLGGRREHWPRDRSDIPVVPIDRGGQITYHGPGQVVAYVLLDMKRRGLTVRPLVRSLEQAVIDSVEAYGVQAEARIEAPGVYVDNAKIAALGLRITRGCAYHGLALNVDMDLSPFQSIDPCGYPGLTVTQLRDLGVTRPVEAVAADLCAHLLERLG